MSPYKEMIELASTLNVRIAVVQVRQGESNQEAWNRHLEEHPHDANAMIKVFNQPRKTKGLKRT